MRFRSASPLAKLRPPDLRHVLHRARLHDSLDSVRGTALWLCGPPGAGKTTLAASYAQHSGQKVLWYRLDADDNDVGRFFETLGHLHVSLIFQQQLSERVFSVRVETR